jgi:hypothetical protein
MIDTEKLDFHPQYVNLFYGGLMGFNLTNKEVVPNPVEFLNSVRSIKEELTNDEILTLLNANWRPSKVGAWIIGLCRIEELEKDLIKYLNNQPNYCEHVIINLTILNSEDGNKAINQYLSNQLLTMLNYSIEGKEIRAIDIYDRNSISCAFNAIRYLDSMNTTGNYLKLVNSYVWISIKKEWSRISKTNPRANGFLTLLEELENVDLGFENVMKTIKKADNTK